MTPPLVIIITGISGSGKSTALKVLEDTGFFCVDNVPVVIIPRIVELLIGEELAKQRMAFVIDVRGKEFFSQFPELVDYFRKMEIQFRVIFLDCDDDVLVRRFSETRRKHPLSESENPLDSIGKEREFLKTVRSYVDLYINTADMSIHELKEFIRKEMPVEELTKLNVTFLSFGFKYGIPAEADILFDARFLPNPHFVGGLKDKDGREEEVRKYIFANEDSRIYIDKIGDLLDFLLPKFIGEGKAYLTVAIGCTGGRHRSVAVAEEVVKFIGNKHGNADINVKHRDITKTESGGA
ncbi:MAG: RNase adapter RapZ [Deltaproteobacteria bacterium]|nr:RNase adapter RapZ [Deltaproteobacteria bacterium]NIS78565.1 RNase adapter RapZ [Deltaproteobacteria bacterium]